MTARLRPASPAELSAALSAHDTDPGDRDAARVLVKHFLAVLSARAPGRAVEVRVPPYAAAQVIGGTTHTRGTPPAVVETDPDTWVALALGRLRWDEAERAGRVRASGERSDLSEHLPLHSSGRPASSP